MRATGLSVLIVTRNSLADIGTCLSLLTESRIGRGCEVIVVDNASTDGTQGFVAGRFPEVLLIPERVNRGFAGANAIGFAASRGLYILLLSPAACLADPDAVAAMAAHLDAHPAVDAVGAKPIRPDGPRDVGDTRFAPQPPSVSVHALTLSDHAGLSGLDLPERGAEPVGPATAGWLGGACVMMRRQAVTADDSLGSRFVPEVAKVG